jgi:mono/diheme cytochrome c family protein
MLVWSALLVVGCGKAPAPSLLTEGQTYFDNYCAACHHPDGFGVKGGGPPLVASPWVAGAEARLIRIVLGGVRGPLQVGEQTYNLEMPGFGQVLSDAQIAALLSYVRRRFGRSAAPILPATVSRVRDESGDRDTYWTADELREVR